MRYKHKSKYNEDQLSFSFNFVKRSWKNNPIILTLILLIFLFSIRASFRVYQNKNESEKAALAKQEEFKNLEDRQNLLYLKLKRIATPEGRESELRKKFTVGKPGENVAIIVEAEEGTSTSVNLSIWQSIRNFFLALFKK